MHYQTTPLTDSGNTVVIFTGRFGSGKTEISINYALSLTRPPRSAHPILIDLDLVTPYFRTREMAEEMRSLGVEVIAPAAVAQHIDLPGVSPEILGALQQEERPVVMDVGGDKQGARALGQFSSRLQQRGYTMHFVVNPYRPFMDTVEGIAAAVAEIEASSRLKATTLVSNPNLLTETTAAVVEEGHRLVEEAAQALGLSVAFIVLEQKLARYFGDNHFPEPILVLQRFFHPPWQERPQVVLPGGPPVRI